MTIYVLPASEHGLKDELFKPGEHEARGGFSNFQYWAWLKRRCSERGIAIHTTDFWSREKRAPDDILLVQNHPDDSLLWRSFYALKHARSRGGFVLARRRFFHANCALFRKRILWHAESPMATPYVYTHIDRIWRSGLYHKIILLGRKPGSPYSHIDYYSMREYALTSAYFKEPKEKFLVMINSNTAPHSLGDEFYGERLRAIRYFERVPGFDLYGYRWDKAPRHPLYIHYKRFVDRVWRGVVDDKLKTLSAYTFSLCFENCSYPGYVSEKIFDCLAAGTIPVYLGAPDIGAYVPADCFIDFRKFASYDELLRFLRSVSGEEAAGWRGRILQFLSDNSTMGGLNALIDQILE